MWHTVQIQTEVRHPVAVFRLALGYVSIHYFTARSISL